MKNLAIMIMTAFALTACHTHETRYVHTPPPPKPVYKPVTKKHHPKKRHAKKRHKSHHATPPKEYPVPVNRHHH